MADDQERVNEGGSVDAPGNRAEDDREGGGSGEAPSQNQVITLARQLVQALEGPTNATGESSRRTNTHSGE